MMPYPVMLRGALWITGIVMLVSLFGCAHAKHSENITRNVGNAVNYYCALMPDAMRLQFKYQLNQSIQPNGIHISCANGMPPLTIWVNP